MANSNAVDDPQVDRRSTLPPEILLSIFRNLSKPGDLYSLCRVDKSFHALAIPLLYESFEIYCAEGNNPRFSNTWPDMKYTSNLKHVRNLAVSTTFYDFDGMDDRCWHNREAGDEERPNYNDSHFLDFCYGLSENTLKSFRWKLGTYVPLKILGSNGYLTRHQTRLKKLALITDGACEQISEGMLPYDLTKFHNIRNFSWIAPQAKEDFDAIKHCLHLNAMYLEVLELDLINWESAANWWYMDHTCRGHGPHKRENFFAEDIIGLSLDRNARDHYTDVFPALQSLSLGQLSFQSAISGLVSAFSFFQLKQLKLCNCPQMAHLLMYLTNSDRPLQLNSLELTCWDYQCNDDASHMESAVPPFLRKVSGLRDLYLGLPILKWEAVADSLEHHVETLRCVAFHARLLHDVNLHACTQSENRDHLCGGFYQLFTRGNCEIIGMNIHPEALISRRLGLAAQHVSCKLLHFRVSGESLTIQGEEMGFVDFEEVEEFVEWAFSPDGMPELLVVAYGDFAFPDLHGKDSKLICRNETFVEDGSAPRYRKLKPTDWQLWALVQDNMETLSACAYRPRLRV